MRPKDDLPRSGPPSPSHDSSEDAIPAPAGGVRQYLWKDSNRPVKNNVFETAFPKRLNSRLNLSGFWSSQYASQRPDSLMSRSLAFSTQPNGRQWRTAPDAPQPVRQQPVAQMRTVHHHQWSQPVDARVSARKTGDLLAARDAMGGCKCPVPQAAANVCRRRLP